MRHEDRQRARDHEVVERAARVLDDPVPLLLVDHVAPAVGEHARRARVEHEQPRVAEVAVERPAARRRLAVPLVRELAAAAGRRRRPPATRWSSRLLGELGRREVAEVLVDPVRHERAGDARLPPRLARASPRPRLQEMFQSSLTSWSSKIIARRHGREQPADVRVATTTRGRAACTPRSRRPARPAARVVSRRLADERERRRRDLVGVDLVAEQQQRVGPLGSRRAAAAREYAQSASIPSAVGLVRARASRAVGCGAPTRHEPKTSRACRSSLRVWTTARRPAVVGRPDALAVEAHLVRRRPTPGSRSSTSSSA